MATYVSTDNLAFMSFAKGEIPYCPKTGSTIKVDSIPDKDAIERIKQMLSSNPRNLFFVYSGS